LIRIPPRFGGAGRLVQRGVYKSRGAASLRSKPRSLQSKEPFEVTKSRALQRREAGRWLCDRVIGSALSALCSSARSARLNSLFPQKTSLIRPKNSLFCCVGNSAVKLLNPRVDRRRKSRWMAGFLKNSLLISLLAGKFGVETSSQLTASSARQSGLCSRWAMSASKN
jgi:hypothetical protein